MCSFGTDEYISRIVTQYSSTLLRIAMTRLSSPPTRRTPSRRSFCACSLPSPISGMGNTRRRGSSGPPFSVRWTFAGAARGKTSP